MQIQPSALAAFIPFSTPLEGNCPKPYVDDENLVTVGMGNLIDATGQPGAGSQPEAPALALPFKYDSDGTPASQAAIIQAWHIVKDGGYAGTGGGNQQHLTTIHLDQADILDLITKRLASNEAWIVQFIPGYADLYADAQLAVAAMVWAVGPGTPPAQAGKKGLAGYPKLLAALNSSPPNYGVAAQECRISNGTALRNKETQLLFLNAMNAQANGADPSVLVWTPSEKLPGTMSIATATAIKTGVGLAILVGLTGSAAYLAWKYGAAGWALLSA